MTGPPRTAAPTARELCLRNSLGELRRLQEEVEAFGRQHALPARAVFELTLALDECFTNIVRHGYDDDGPHAITVRLDVGGTGPARVVQVEIEDDARPFDPRSVPVPPVDLPLERRPVGGLGVHLVRHCVDDLAYERVGNRNRLLLRKHVPE